MKNKNEKNKEKEWKIKKWKFFIIYFSLLRVITTTFSSSVYVLPTKIVRFKAFELGDWFKVSYPNKEKQKKVQ